MFLFFFNDTATTEIYTLSLHDALPIYAASVRARAGQLRFADAPEAGHVLAMLGVLQAAIAGELVALLDRKSTRLNSSHGYISYAVFCLKKKKKKKVPLDQGINAFAHRR